MPEPCAVCRCCCCCCAVALLLLLLLQLLLAFSKDISRLRARYISMLPRGTTSHTVLITGVRE